MKTIKYPIQEVEIKKIPGNRMLALGITESQKSLCEKSMRTNGLLTPIVLMENVSGEFITLAGEKELQILKEMDVKRADVFVTPLKSESDSLKMILLLSSFKSELNALSEGLILQELIKASGCNQQELSKKLMRSESWVSKRLSLVERLNGNVSEMVLSKQLCPAAAQNIAQLPKEAQHQFAIQVYSKSIPKSKVEQLVNTFNSKNTPEALKMQIIRNPVSVQTMVKEIQLKKHSKNPEKKQELLKLDTAIRLLLKLVCEIEVSLASIPKGDIKKYIGLLDIALNAVKRFNNLLSVIVSPGKLEGGVEDAPNRYRNISDDTQTTYS